MIPLYYAYVAFSNLSMVSTVMGLYLERVGFSLAGVGVLFGALQLGKRSRRELWCKGDPT